MDGDAAQIDHPAFNCFGIVNLFQTKSFSTGLTIDAGGTCWNGWGCQRQEIASPLLQTKRHESTLRKALAQCGYDVIEFRHFVLVDYKAKLEKPAKALKTIAAQTVSAKPESKLRWVLVPHFVRWDDCKPQKPDWSTKSMIHSLPPWMVNNWVPRTAQVDMVLISSGRKMYNYHDPPHLAFSRTFQR